MHELKVVFENIFSNGLFERSLDTWLLVPDEKVRVDVVVVMVEVVIGKVFEFECAVCDVIVSVLFRVQKRLLIF